MNWNYVLDEDPDDMAELYDEEVMGKKNLTFHNMPSLLLA